MKKIIVFIMFFIYGTMYLTASVTPPPYSGGGGAAVDVEVESREIPEALKPAQEKLNQAEKIITEVQQAKPLGKKNQTRSQKEIKEFLKEAIKISLDFFYKSCCESISSLREDNKQLKNLIKTVQKKILAKEYDEAYEYSKKIYYQILKLPDCLNQLKIDRTKTPSKECLKKLNSLIFELDNHFDIQTEDCSPSMMSVISPVVGKVSAFMFTSPKAYKAALEVMKSLPGLFNMKSLPDLFLAPDQNFVEGEEATEVARTIRFVEEERQLQENNFAKESTCSPGPVELALDQDTVPSLEELLEDDLEEIEQMYKKLLDQTNQLMRLSHENKSLLVDNDNKKEQIGSLQNLLFNLRSQLIKMQTEHKELCQNKDQIIANWQTDCESLKAQLEKLKIKLKKTDQNNLFLLKKMYLMSQEAKSLEADLSYVIQEIKKQAATIAEQNFTIADQNSTIKDKDLTIAEQNSTIEELLLEIEKLLLEIKENKSTIRKLFAENEKQAATIAEQKSKIVDKKSTITKLNTVIAVFNFRKLLLNSTIKKQDSTIKKQDSTIKKQAAENEKQAATIADQDSTIKAQKEQIGSLQNLLFNLRSQLIKMQTEHKELCQNKDQIIANWQTDCESLKAQLEKLKTELEKLKIELKKTDENNSFLLQAIYSIDQQAKSLEADLSKIIQEHFLTIEKQIEVKNTQAAKIDRLFAKSKKQKAKIKALELKELWLKRVAGGIAVIAAGWLCIKYVPSSINSFTQGFSSFWRRYATRTRSYVKS